MAKKVKTITVCRPSSIGMLMEAILKYDFKTEYIEPHITKQDEFHNKNFFRGKQHKK
jgi:hypothetical protein